MARQSDGEHETINAAVIQHRIQVAISAAIYVGFYLLPEPVHTSIRTGQRITKEILRTYSRRVLEVIRMLITTFLDLQDWVVERGLLRSTRYVSVEEQIMMFWWMVGHGATNREACEQFQHAGDTVSR